MRRGEFNGASKMETKNEELKFLDPEAILRQLDVASGSMTADFGCGSGYFSVALAKILGSDGKVFALDVMKQALESVESRASFLGLQNIVTKRVNLEKENGSELEEGSLDLVVMKDMLFQNKNKAVILSEAERVLKIGGKLLIVEWKKEENGVGPEIGVRIEEKGLQKMVEEARLQFEQKIEAGNFHYALVFKK
jgi:ubiquinone/menaquinone biosynthesis C-methylase UbiE